jgi:hypothetical protein
MQRMTHAQEQIVTKVVAATLLAAYRIEVWDPDDLLSRRSTDTAQIVAAAADTDQCLFDIFHYEGHSLGAIWFKFGKQKSNPIIAWNASLNDLLLNAGCRPTHFRRV